MKPVHNERLLRGKGRYVADLQIEGTLSAAFLRSPHAHARIKEIDLEKARELPGVVGVFGPKEGGNFPHLPLLFPSPNLVPVTQKPLNEVVHHVGEPVAVVVAENRYIAEDAIDLIDVEYEQLPAVVDLQEALEGKDLTHEHLQSNIAAQFTPSVGNAKEAMKEADVVVTQSFNIGRVSCLPIETRGLLAKWDDNGTEEQLVVYAATQSQHEMRNILAQLLNLRENQVRVIAPDVGGAFGAKAVFYVEDIIIPWVARQVGAPVRWVEDRNEHMQSAIHEREQIHEASLGVTKEGKIVAVIDNMLANNGAYVPWGVIVPIMTSSLIPGPYKVPNYLCDLKVLYTNTVPLAPYRGAGRPQAAVILNRLLDKAAKKLNMDPVEIKRKNLIQKHEFPYKTGLLSRDGSPQVYDSGNYEKLVEKARENGKYEYWRNKQKAYKKQGRHIGIGFAVAIKNTGYGSFEGATVRVEGDGSITINSGAATQGQSHETTLAQIAAEIFNVSIDKVNVKEGDTSLISYGTGTFASRIATIVGTAVYNAANEVKEKMLTIAAVKLNVEMEDLVLKDGVIHHRENQEIHMSLADVVLEARAFPPGTTYNYPVSPGLEATDYFAPKAAAISSMADVAVVEVDPDTFQINILNYTSIHDCGRVLNPLVVEGQIVGGIANGIGNAMFEEIIYDNEGQLLNGTLMDYLVPTSYEVPNVHFDHIETLSPLNPLGIKGAGESGTVPVLAVIQSAVEDALRDRDISIGDLPVKPSKIRERMRKQHV